MKLLMIIGLMLSFGAMAGESVIARYEFAYADSNYAPFGGTFSHIVADVTEGAQLLVKVTQRRARPNPEPVVREYAVNLSEASMSTIEREIEVLKTAKIEKRTSQIVCRLMPTPLMAIDSLYVVPEFSNHHQPVGTLELVDGPRGCWLYEQTHPAELYAQNAARNLKQFLKILSLQEL